MTTPQSMIQSRIKARVRELCLTSQEVAKGVDDSPLYGEFSHGTYRNLVTEDYDSEVKPRTTINKQLVIALSAVLECQVSDLATEYEMQSLRDVPYRRAQWPRFLLDSEYEANPKTRVPMPGKTANILRAYMKQHGISNYTYFAQSITNNGYRITGKQLVRAIGDNRHPAQTRKFITYELCEAVAQVFRGPFNRESFESEWLITCRPDLCPHCDDRLISY